MATRTDIIELRLRLNDPADFINIIDVDELTDLPAAPLPQTCYYVVATGLYYSTTKTTGATSADYTTEDLYVSDARLSIWIGLYGVDKSECEALKQIISVVGRQFGIVKNTAGAESTEYIKLSELYAYYKQRLALCSESTQSKNNNSTGRIGQMKQPEIMGGIL